MNINLDKIDLDVVDKSNMREHLANFYVYAKDAYEIANAFAIPSYFIKCKKILILGMGASGIAGEYLKDLLNESQLVVKCLHDYNLPGWVDNETLVIAISHSGNTEEVLYALVSAYQKNAKLLSVTTGGKLEGLASKYRSPIIKYSLDAEPKLAFPYLFIIPLVILKKLGHLEINQSDFDKAMILLSAQIDKLSINNHTAVNPAKDLATKIVNSIIYIISSDNLRTSGIRFANEINENGKNFSAYNFLPEINHNFVAGLEFPKSVIENLCIIFLESKYARVEIKKRENITAHLFGKKKISYIRLNFPQSISKFSEILLSVNFVDFVAMYLGILNQVDPTSAKIVEQIKQELSKE